MLDGRINQTLYFVVLAVIFVIRTDTVIVLVGVHLVRLDDLVKAGERKQVHQVKDEQDDGHHQEIVLGKDAFGDSLENDDDQDDQDNEVQGF